MRTNTKARTAAVRTHEGGPAYPHLKPYDELRRTVLACLLFEDNFYEDGKSVADRIAALAVQVKPEQLAMLAIEARRDQHLRHAPLALLVALQKIAAGRPDQLVANTVSAVVSRPDEMGELLSLYWKAQGGRKMVPAAMRKGLARAFAKFNEYRLAKYDRDSAVKLRDVLRLVRPTPENDEQAALWKRVVKRELAVPDTWEVALSGGADKKEAFTRLIMDAIESNGRRGIGYLALLRNLRNMQQAGVDEHLVATAILARQGGAQRVLPFRYVAAARACPQYEPALDIALQVAIKELPAPPGRTVVLVDVSGSMNHKLSAKSDLTAMDAAATLAAVFPGTVRMFTFSHLLVEVPPRRGMAGVDAVIKSQPHGGTFLRGAMENLNRTVDYDRLIVITDEQSNDGTGVPKGKHNYMINVASNQHGVGYGSGWTAHITGFSEGVIRYIQAAEGVTAPTFDEDHDG